MNSRPWNVRSLIGRITIFFFQLKVSSPTNRALFAETDGAQESKAPADSHLPSSSSQGSSNLSPSLNSGSIFNLDYL